MPKTKQNTPEAKSNGKGGRSESAKANDDRKIRNPLRQMLTTCFVSIVTKFNEQIYTANKNVNAANINRAIWMAPKQAFNARV